MSPKTWETIAPVYTYTDRPTGKTWHHHPSNINKLRVQLNNTQPERMVVNYFFLSTTFPNSFLTSLADIINTYNTTNRIVWTLHFINYLHTSNIPTQPLEPLIDAYTRWPYTFTYFPLPVFHRVHIHCTGQFSRSSGIRQILFIRKYQKRDVL